jgi:hypothetical protein
LIILDRCATKWSQIPLGSPRRMPTVWPLGLPCGVGRPVLLCVQASPLLYGITLCLLCHLCFPLLTTISLSFIRTEMYWDGGGSP